MKGCRGEEDLGKWQDHLQSWKASSMILVSSHNF